MNTTSTPPVDRVLTAVAEADDVDPATMEPPLATVVDPDSLNELAGDASDSPAESLEVRFTYRGHDVVVSADGVEIR